MNLYKRVLSTFTVVVFIFVLAACGNRAQLEEGKINIFTSFYPLYDFASQIGGEHVHVVNLVPAGVEPHDWEPKSRELADIRNAELFIYNGAGFESWVHDFLNSLNANEKVAVLEVTEGLQLIKAQPGQDDGHGHGEAGHKEEEHGHAQGETEHKEDEHGHAEGETEHKEGEHGHEHDAAEAAHEDEHEGFDPHTWLSPLMAQQMAGKIKDKLIEIDPAHKADYEANFNKLNAKLGQLHQQYKETITAAPSKEIVVSHQAFGYIARDYGLTQMPIMGLAPDAEPTAQDMKRIAEFAREHQVKVIYFEELVSDKLAKTLANEIGIGTAVLNPLEGLTEEQQKAGETYVSIMEKNLESLKKGLYP
ncbi:metal ABC transporter solute-binding protein, Zn/Mn family [Paenibacillus turpanensis]|uniref:metal ABC transporter solute-binding protein, Zn/Mn family n=1 Tax=Paenibacillus turpanensis TaxID=2689078 RepID=UPI00140CB6DA|nr:zinc ABC transporter substrate-binding protein [Paenibacillus turpanensis]